MRKGFLLPFISEVNINCFAHADFLHAHLRVDVIWFLFGDECLVFVLVVA
jgi:hypothetical protein